MSLLYARLKPTTPLENILFSLRSSYLFISGMTTPVHNARATTHATALGQPPVSANSRDHR